ncbi:MAG TPA: DNA methyltransferase [Conexibacter sp.]|nr:DNA methyltransferase [Conexibacter sp.]
MSGGPGDRHVLAAPTWQLLDTPIVEADCIDAMRAMPDCSVDAVVTDPPYGIGFMGHEWDQPGFAGAPRGGGRRGHRSNFSRRGDAAVGETASSRAPAGRDDLSATANQRFQAWCEAWGREALRVLKPGGHAVVFGGTRTFHRLTCGLEDAGFEIRDTLAWMFGSGFPKSLDVSKAIDKAGGDPLAWRTFARAYAEAVEASPLSHADIDRELGIRSSSCYWARRDHRGGMPPRRHWERVRELLGLPPEFAVLYDEAEREVIGQRTTGIGTGSGIVRVINDGNRDLTAPATADAEQWDGWGTALKPGYEPIVLARKPLAGTVAATALAHGTGAINIDGCRIATSAADAAAMERCNTPDCGRMQSGSSPIGTFERASSSGALDTQKGRWPANVVLSHTPDCVLVGERPVRGNGHTPSSRAPSTFGRPGQDAVAERSFDGELVEAWECAPGCPVGMLDEQSGELKSGFMAGETEREGLGYRGGLGCLVRHDTIGDRGGASRFFYCAKTSRAEREAGLEALDAVERSNGNKWTDRDYRVEAGERPETAEAGPRRNTHPTVKPVDLMRWLLRLVTPPGGIVLDPFAGSGSTVCAGACERIAVVGIEREPGYASIARARAAWWAEHPEGPRAQRRKPRPSAELTLLDDLEARL